MKKHKKMWCAVFMMIAVTAVSCAKSGITIDGNKFEIGMKVSQLPMNLKPKQEISKIKDNQEDDVELLLKNDKYQEGFSVIVENGTSHAINPKDAKITMLIIDVRKMKQEPEVIIDKKIKWHSSRKEIEKMFGKPSDAQDTEDMTILMYRSQTNFNLYLDKDNLLYRMIIFN